MRFLTASGGALALPDSWDKAAYACYQIGVVMSSTLLADVFLIITLCVCVVTDLSVGKIFNMVTLPAFLLGLAVNLATGGWSGLGSSLLGFSIGFGLFLLIYLSGGMGAGDVKLMGAAGALVGYPLILEICFWVVLVGGAMALVILVTKGRFIQSLRRVLRTLFTLLMPFLVAEPLSKDEGLKFPYGLGIAIGGAVALYLSRLHDIHLVTDALHQFLDSLFI